MFTKPQPLSNPKTRGNIVCNLAPLQSIIRRGNTDRSHFQIQKPGSGTGKHRTQPFTKPMTEGNIVRSHFQVQQPETDKGMHNIDRKKSTIRSHSRIKFLAMRLRNLGITNRSHFQARGIITKPCSGTGNHKLQPFSSLQTRGNTTNSHFSSAETHESCRGKTQTAAIYTTTEHRTWGKWVDPYCDTWGCLNKKHMITLRGMRQG